MKRLKWLGMAVLTLMAMPALAATGNINVFLGQKSLDSNDWSPFEDQVEVGVLIDFRMESWPLSIAIDLLGSADTISTPFGDLTASTSELDFGVRKVFELPGSVIRPYIGGGLALVGASFELEQGGFRTSIEDNGTGYWLNGGVYWRLAERFNLGLDVRYSKADVSFGGITANAGGMHTGIILGYHW